jgi:hypothetical protein
MTLAAPAAGAPAADRATLPAIIINLKTGAIHERFRKIHAQRAARHRVLRQAAQPAQ